ncbi:MAG: flagellar motor protein MotB [Planctomycetes bacterium]|nr:flagellar motor protein MotB [Planctomycetota bacterium]
MKSVKLASAWLALAVLVGGGSGCSVQALKDQNRRLKEANDRLISENNKLEEELAALQRRLGGGLEDPGDPLVAADPGGAIKKGAPKSALIDDIRSEVEVFETKQGIKVRVPDRVFFALGQATLSRQGQRILDKVARLINSYPGHVVRVDGHTDDTPIRKIRHLYPTNWELSSARACTVVRYLVDKGSVGANRIFPAGFSFYRPVATGRSSSARSQNRRVEITILNETA